MSNDNRRARQQHQGARIQRPPGQIASPPQPPFMTTEQGYADPSVNPYYAQQHPPVSPTAYPDPNPRRSPQPHLDPHTVPKSVFTSTPTSVLLPPSSEEQALLRGKLSVIQGEQKGETWFLNRVQTSVGRALDNDLVLLDISSSRKHAQIMRHAQGFTLLDLRSANGVYLNGRRISEEELYDGDEIEIGETIMRFEMVGATRIRIMNNRKGRIMRSKALTRVIMRKGTQSTQ